jgi:hypothetical protein
VHGKHPDLAHSTPYLGNTSAPGNMGTLFLGTTTAPGNTGVLASTSTSHPGSTSGNVIYVAASSPYMGSTSMGNPGGFPTASVPYPGAHPLWVTQGYLHMLPNLSAGLDRTKSHTMSSLTWFHIHGVFGYQI